MEIMLDPITCTSCHACVSLCPAECISMREDELGFLRPVIDYTQCIRCGLCIKVCKETREIPSCESRKIYAAKHKETSVKKKSASGGVFTALSDCVLQAGGIIVGAKYSENMSVKHDIAHTVQERDSMRGSKYTYSLCDKQIFTRVRNYLDMGKVVLFTGTPCQATALKLFLKRPYNNLILVDILCHGIAAPVLYRDFINILRKENDPVLYIDFRYSPDGNWHSPRTQVVYQSGRKRQGERENSYFRMFVQNYCLRESCYDCCYARFDRISDITLGDFWGIEKSCPEFDSAHGVSVVVVNSEKGADLFEKARKSLDILQCEERDCTHKQLNGVSHESRNVNFLYDYRKNGYDFVYKKYVKVPWSIRIREQIYRVAAIRKLRDLIKERLGRT